eukprot:12304300-Heterocapsa_arctica.AAC.1
MNKGRIAAEKDIAQGCESKGCLTCLAQRNSTGCTSSTYEMADNPIPDKWCTMANGQEYKNWTITDNIDK